MYKYKCVVCQRIASAGRIKSTRNNTTLHKERNSIASTCGVNQIFPAHLGTDNTRLVGITDCTGVLSTSQ